MPAQSSDMPRAHRHFLPGYVWHITHRCHNRSYLLQNPATRSRWVHWLRKAHVDFGVTVLNYAVTCNHIHLLTSGGTSRNVIPRSIQLVAGRTGQEFNADTSRRGAFWEDRYHATAVESGAHLVNCLTYIDLNMVRAGVVKHPSDWVHGGYCEIREPARRGRLIDHEALLGLLGVPDLTQLRRLLDDAIDRAMISAPDRQPKWTEALAVGGQTFLDEIKSRLGSRASRRSIIPSYTALDEGNTSFELREPTVAYGTASETSIREDDDSVLSGDNSFLWQAEFGEMD